MITKYHHYFIIFCISLILFIRIQSYTQEIITESNKIIGFMSNKDGTGIYYFTKTQLIEITEPNNKNILISNLNFTDHTEIDWSIQVHGLIIASCTKEHLFELFSIDGELKQSKEYPNTNITESSILDKCALGTQGDIGRIIQIFYKEPSGSIKIKYSYFYISDTFTIDTYKESDDSTSVSDYFSDTDTHLGQCFQLSLLSCVLRKSGGLSYFSVSRSEYLSKGNVFISSKPEYKIIKFYSLAILLFTYENNELKIYKFKDEAVFQSDQLNQVTFKTRKNFENDLNFISGVNMGYADKLLLCYKERGTNNLILEESIFKDNVYTYSSGAIIPISNGFSEILCERLENDKYFIWIRGSGSNNNTVQILFYDLNKGIFGDETICPTSTVNAYSKEILSINLPDYVTYTPPNDIISFYPEELNSFISLSNDNTLNVNINIDYGLIEIYMGLQKTISRITLTDYFSKCKIIVQVCATGCLKCSSNDFTSSNTKCEEKMCISGYYYDSTDPTKCLKLKNKCYENCNTCEKEGSSYYMYCTTCKLGYNLDPGKNCKCTQRFYKENYEYKCLDDDNCSLENYPYYIIDNLECFSQCPSDKFHLKNEFECISACPSGKKIIKGLNICVDSCNDPDYSDYVYTIENDDYCYNQCPNNYFHHENEFECLRTCNENYYGYPPTRLCVSSCLDYNYYFINSTMQCMQNCSFYYNIKDTYECISTCPEGLFGYTDENRNKTCISECPTYFDRSSRVCMDNCSYKKNIENTYECVSTCPDDYFTYDSLCVTKCPKYYTSYNNKCVDSCPSFHPYAIEITYECINVCPNDYYILHNENEELCVKKCPNFCLSDSKECVEQCPTDLSFVMEITYECINQCPTDYYLVQSDNLCVQTCPNFFDSSNNYCYDLCPNDKLYHIENEKECLNSCPSNYFILEEEKKCVLTCPKYYSTDNNKCYDTCPSNYQYLVRNSDECVSRCPSNYYIIEEEKLCADSCVYTNNKKYYIKEQMKCLENCPSNNKYTKKNDYQCLPTCPQNYYIVEEENLCVNSCENSNYKYYNEGSFKCISQCNENYKYHIENEYKCINSCPNNYYLIENENLCVQNCPSNYPFLVRQLSKCYNQCPTNFEYHNENEYECLNECPFYKFILENNKLCVDSCPNDISFIVPNSNICYEKCPKNYPYHIENSNECIINCPKTHPKIIDELNMCITYHCSNSENKYFTKDSKKCYKECPEGYDFKLNDTLDSYECFNECPKHYFLIENSKLCVKHCEYDFSSKNNKECECIFKLNKISNYNLKCERTNNIVEYIQDVSKISDRDELMSTIDKYVNYLKDNSPIIHTQNTTIHVTETKIEDIDYNKNKNISSLYLGECENILKQHYNIEKFTPLTIVLLESNSTINSLIHSIKYNVFDQNGNKLDKSLCDDVKVHVYYALDDNKIIDINLVNYLQDNNYDLFNLSSDFYNERCLGFNYEDNDIVVKDRINRIYPIVSVCGAGCDFIDYNDENKRSKCSCDINNKENEKVKNETKNLLKILKSQINYDLFNCYKSVNLFNKVYKKNLGFWILIILTPLFIIEEIIFIFYSKKNLILKLHDNLKLIGKEKLNNNNKKNRKINPSMPPKKRNYMPNYQNIEKKKESKNKRYSFTLKNENMDNEENKRKYMIKKKNTKRVVFGLHDNGFIIGNTKKIKIEPYNKSQKDNSNYKNDITINLKSNSSKRGLNNQSNRFENSNIKNSTNESESSYITKSSFRTLEIDSFKNEKHNYKDSNSMLTSFSNDKNDDFNKNKNMIRLENKYENVFGDGKDGNYEEMTFGQALKYDKRTFLRIYFSFLFSKLELIATFFFPDPYSVYSITIPFYILCLLFDFTINALLYTDDIVSQKYVNGGKLGYFTSIVLSAISNLITFLFMKYLGKLIRYSFAFELMKEEKNEKDYLNYVNRLLKIVKRRLILYFIIEIILTFLCCYYLYIFCAIYQKSQISLVINYFIGLLLSLGISFIISLIVTLLRIISLKCKIKNLYYSSRFLIELI